MNPFLVNIAIITVLDIGGIISAKLYSIHKNPLLLLATFVLFGSAGIMFAKTLKYEGMAITNVLWIALSIIIGVIIGYSVFKEEIAPIQFIGMGIIVIGLFLINWK